MKFSPILSIAFALFSLSLPACNKVEQESVEEEAQKIVVTNPEVKDVVATQQYVCQIHSRRHIEIRALESGYLKEIKVKEGQVVKQGDLLFEIVPVLYQAKLDSEVAEAQLAQIEFMNTQKLFQDHVVSDKEVALAKAKLAKAEAQVNLAQAEFNFANVKAPFDGIIDRLHNQQGSLIEEGDILTTLSDNSLMWVYFNVPEARYLEYKANLAKGADEMRLELVLANGEKFPEPGKIGAIEADFNNETGNIAFRADFPNPNSLLRHGQTGTILIHRDVHNAVVIPQRATFEILDKRYVYLVGKDDVVHQHQITVDHEFEDVFVVGDGVKAGDKVVLEGVRQIHDGEKVEFEMRKPEVVLNELKDRAE